MNKNYFLLIFIPILFFMLYYGNIKPLLASRAGVRKEIERTLKYNTFVNHEFRKTLALEAIKSKDQELILLAKEEMEKNIQMRPMDVKSLMILSFLYYILGENSKAIETAERALGLAPNRQDIQKMYKTINPKKNN